MNLKKVIGRIFRARIRILCAFSPLVAHSPLRKIKIIKLKLKIAFFTFFANASQTSAFFVFDTGFFMFFSILQRTPARTLRGSSENQTGDCYAARVHKTDCDSETRVAQCSHSGTNFWQHTVCCKDLFPRKLHSTLPKTEPCCYVYWESSGNVVGWRRMKLPELVVSHNTD